ncbi:MAG TPA: DEAD/DEAH box helicase [Candidatus Saccharimonadales bacterium]|nr:DEAD/DEAH box helicase [Candidatus Saccharimonadales bacterium]
MSRYLEIEERQYGAAIKNLNDFSQDEATYPHLMQYFDAEFQHLNFIKGFMDRRTHARDLPPRDAVIEDVNRLLSTEQFWGLIEDDLNKDPSVSYFWERTQPLPTMIGYAFDYCRSPDAFPPWREYITFDYKPPANDENLNKQISSVRKQIRERHYDYGPTWSRKIFEQSIQDPQFWADVEAGVHAVGTLPKPARWKGENLRSFFRKFDPDKPEDVYAHDLDSIRGVYYPIYLYLNTSFAKVKKETGVGPSRKAWSNPIMEAAPDNIKLLLRTVYPNDTEPVTLQEIEGIINLPTELRSLMTHVGMLRRDTRGKILDALSVYVGHSKPDMSNDMIYSLLEQEINLLMDQSEQIPEVSASTLAHEAQGIVKLVRSSSNMPKETLAELTNAFAQSYFQPFLSSIMMKPTALYWFANQKAGRAITPDIMRDFSKGLFQGQMFSASQQSPDGVKFLETFAYPSYEARAIGNAEFAPRIRYYKSVDEHGNPKPLLYHQVDEIRTLIEDRGGIEASEAGTGKTVVLVLAATNIETHENDRNRILVVGTRSVIDNWEEELEKHIEGVDVANITFTRDGEKGSLSLGKRIAFLEDRLRQGALPQVVMVNYDVFRNKQFQSLLERYRFDVKVVDETHNVKSKIVSSLKEEKDGVGSSVAQRTRGLYRSLLIGDAPVMLATGTPFVKNLAEPLIMGHLVQPRKITIDDIQRYRNNPRQTHAVVSEVMIRHRKAEIADLPLQELLYPQISFSSLPQHDRAVFVQQAKMLLETSKSPAALFYSLLNLEAQAKFPWFIDTVQKVVADGRRALVVSPFVTGADRNTTEVSTKAIAHRLVEAGIPPSRIGILDGDTSSQERVVVRQMFLNSELDVIVGSDAVGGESITLSGPTNRATDVISFIVPNRIDRFLQDINRIHRLNQTEAVTVHVPYVTEDVLERPQGTYDEQLVARTRKELRDFELVVDGKFFMSPKDYYQEVARAGYIATAKAVKSIVAENAEGTGSSIFRINGTYDAEIFKKEVEKRVRPIMRRRSFARARNQKQSARVIEQTAMQTVVDFSVPQRRASEAFPVPVARPRSSPETLLSSVSMDGRILRLAHFIKLVSSNTPEFQIPNNAYNDLMKQGIALPHLDPLALLEARQEDWKIVMDLAKTQRPEAIVELTQPSQDILEWLFTLQERNQQIVNTIDNIMSEYIAAARERLQKRKT